MPNKLTAALILVLCSCSGYRFANRENALFYNEGIESISIPMFVNRSIYPAVTAPITNETISVFSAIPGVKVFSGENLNADAVLVGIVQSPKRMAQAVRTQTLVTTNSKLKESIGDRAEFLVPASSMYQISIRYLLLKKPSRQMIEALSSEEYEKLKVEGNFSPRVIFDKTFNFSGVFNREAAVTGESDSPGSVNYTKSQMFFKQSVVELSKSSARNLKELILNVF